MWNPFEILFYAQLLSSLTYSLGALFYALPIPVYGIKKWGPMLIKDSIYVAAWILMDAVVLAFAQQIMNMLGVSWDSYFNWLFQVENWDMNAYLILRTIITIVSYVSINYPIFTLFSFLLGLSASYFEFLDMISLMIYQYVGIFVAIGILLMSLPFRIGRSIGASFIGSSLVFYVGLPYMPNFLTALDLNILNLNIPSNPDIQFILQVAIPEIFLANLFMPTAYIAILSGLSIGLGNAIGGYGSRVPFMVEMP